MTNGGQFEHSPELDQFAAALSAAQGEFEAIAKNNTNPFFKSKFADLPAVVKAATPVLAKHGLSVCQLPGHDGGGDTLATIVLHKSGQFVASTMRLRPVKDDPQSLGSATTYGRRYSYMAALGLVADEDDDGNAATQAKRAPRGTTSAPEPAALPTIPLERALALVELAWGIGVEDKLQLAASHVFDADVGDCSTKDAAVVAVGRLSEPQAVKLEAWLSRKADEVAA